MSPVPSKQYTGNEPVDCVDHALDLMASIGCAMSALARLSDSSVRRSIEDEIERLIAMLDAMDPDPDLEPWLADACTNTDDREGDDSELELDNCDDEEGGDAEPSEDGETIMWNDDLRSQEVLVSL